MSGAPALGIEAVERLVGREAELEALDRFLDALAGEASALEIRGEAGIGKTALWKRCVAGASDRDYRILACCPAELERALPFAALGDLLGGIAEDALACLPDPQRRAIDVALLRVEPEGPAPPQRALGLGVLGVLRELAARLPLLLAIDDAHWLDPPSARVLEFATRRLTGEPVGVLTTRRAGAAGAELAVGASTGSSRSRVLELGMLPDAAIDQLLRAESSSPRLTRSVRAQIGTAAAGNPYFALELAAQLARWRPSPDAPLLIPASLRELVRWRVSEPPERARSVAITVAALAHPTVDVVSRACGPQGAASLTSAVSARVVEIDGDRVRLSHPLIGSILYGDAPARTRRSVHRRLAALVDDPDERAHHLALAASTPDAAVARLLDEAAQRVRWRGAPDASAELYEQARALTPPSEPDGIRSRRLAAAECWFEAGEMERARSLLEQTVDEWPSGPDRAAPLTALAWVCAHHESTYRAVDLFRAALAESPSDLRTQIAIERGLGWSAHVLGDVAVADGHARRALALARKTGDPLVLAEALADVGFLDTLRGRGVSRATMEEAVALERGSEAWHQIFGRAGWLYALVLEYAAEYDAAKARLEALLAETLERGDEHSLPFVLSHLCRVELHAGDWATAARHAEECHAATVDTGQAPERAFALSNLALVAALQGRIGDARRAIGAGIALATTTGVLPARYELTATLGLLDLSLGRSSEACLVLSELDETIEAAGFAEPGIFRHEPNAIESMIAAGQLDRAAVLTTRLEGRGKRLNRPFALAGAARCRALLAARSGDLTAAARSIDRSLEQHEELGEPFELARTLLVRGMVERRDRKKRAGRESLEQALELFDGLGAALWSAKAAAELERAGGRTVPARSASLTATESRIAELVAAGQPNKAVASALFLSPKTVEWNLSKIYRKLGIHARAELAARLAAGAGAPIDPGR